MPHTEQHTFYIVALYNRLTDEFYGYSTGQRNGTAKTIPRAKQYKTKKKPQNTEHHNIVKRQKLSK